MFVPEKLYNCVFGLTPKMFHCIKLYAITSKNQPACIFSCSFSRNKKSISWQETDCRVIGMHANILRIFTINSQQHRLFEQHILFFIYVAIFQYFSYICHSQSVSCQEMDCATWFICKRERVDYGSVQNIFGRVPVL